MTRQQEPAPTPLLFAGSAVLGLAALTFAFKGTPRLGTAPWWWYAAAVAAASIAFVALRGRPERHPLLFPLAWLWSLLTGPAVLGLLWHFVPTGGETVSTSVGEFIVPSSHWASLGVSFLGIATLIWFLAMLLTGIILFFYSAWMAALAGVATVDWWRARNRAGGVLP